MLASSDDQQVPESQTLGSNGVKKARYGFV